MPLIFQKRILRADLKNNPGVLYLFGDNEERSGLGGQAGECRGEPNAIGVATKRNPSRAEGAYWSDADYNDHCMRIDKDLEPAFLHARRGGIVVCPADGLGTGLSELPDRAPMTYAHIRRRIAELKAIQPA